MRVVIIGAGEVGKQLARVLCFRQNDVVVVDTDATVLAELKDQLDIMTITGNGAAARCLAKAGIDKADIVFAVTSSSEANLLACSIAKHYHVERKIARIHTNEFFDFNNGLDHEHFGVDTPIIPEYECATDILEALIRPAIKETVKFSHPGAQMVNFQIKPGSGMIGATLAAFPNPALINQVRVCAILRFGELIIPDGSSSFLAFDEIYVAGDQGAIDDLISWADPGERSVGKVIISGGTRLGAILASMLITADFPVCLIEPNEEDAERVAELVGNAALIIQGETTHKGVLEEAGIENCHAFISAHDDDEVNILSCLLAKNYGVPKVVGVTNNPDYIRILAGINMIDCCFSPLVSAVNNLIRNIRNENRQTVAMLKRTNADLLEMTVAADSPVAGKLIRDIEIPAKMVFALIIRGNTLVCAVGDERVMIGDQVVILTDPNSVAEVEQLFSTKRFFKFR